MTMTTAEMKMIFNEVLPEDLRRELDEDARMRDLTMNDAATRILSEHFGVEWRPSNRGYKETSLRFKLRVPEDLHREMRIQAANNLLTIRGIMLHVLSTYYETEIVEPYRRRRRVA